MTNRHDPLVAAKHFDLEYHYEMSLELQTEATIMFRPNAFNDGQDRYLYNIKHVRRSQEDGDPDFVTAAEMQGWSVEYTLYAEWYEPMRYVLTYTFDGPVSAGAGAVHVDSVFEFQPGAASNIRAFQAAVNRMTELVTDDIEKNL